MLIISACGIKVDVSPIAPSNLQTPNDNFPVSLITERNNTVPFIPNLLVNTTTHEGFSSSSDGRYIVFTSHATYGLGAAGIERVYLFDNSSQELSIVSKAVGNALENCESYQPKISRDGSTVVFASCSTNLASTGATSGAIYLYNVATESLVRLPIASPIGELDISDDGEKIAFTSGDPTIVAGDMNGVMDAFIFDTLTSTPTRVSVSTLGTELDGASLEISLSGNGLAVSFNSSATNLIDGTTLSNEIKPFIHHTLSGATEMVGRSKVLPDGPSHSWSISADGRYVAFSSSASNFVAGDTIGTTDIFIKDTQNGSISLVSTNSSGVQADDSSDGPAISADGRYVAFYSNASNLVPGDINPNRDIFIKDTQTGAISLVSVDSSGVQPDFGGFSELILSANGRYVAFTYDSGSWGGNTFGRPNIFLKDTQTGVLSSVSSDSNGIQQDGVSGNPSMSANGRYVAFYSYAPTLVSGDINSNSDIFIKDTQTGAISLVSTDSTGIQGNNVSAGPSLSADGRYVSFWSAASNLVNGDTNGNVDIFVKDTQTGTIALVSRSSGGAVGNSHSWNPIFSNDGRYVAFRSEASNLVPGDTNGAEDVFIKDLQTGSISLVSSDSTGVRGNSSSSSPRLSADGRYVTFQSSASNLIQGDINGVQDVFIKDTVTGEIKMIQGRGYVNFDAPAENLKLSQDGSFLFFETGSAVLDSSDTNGITDVYKINTFTLDSLRVSLDENGNQLYTGVALGGVSSDGSIYQLLTFGGEQLNSDGGSPQNAYKIDENNGTIQLISFDGTGPLLVPTQNWLGLLGDGSSLFGSQIIATGIGTDPGYGIYKKSSGPLEAINLPLYDGDDANRESYSITLSADGRYVAFVSEASNLVSGDAGGFIDIFIKDNQTGVINLVSSDSSGVQADSDSYSPSISADGRYVAFSSNATNLVTGDTNGTSDIFIKDTQTGIVSLVSSDLSGVQGYSQSTEPSLSADGRFVAFTSEDSSLVAGDSNGSSDIFIKDTQTGVISIVSADASGVQGNGSSQKPGVSADGRFVVFSSLASNLVVGDTNAREDVFIKDTQSGTINLISSDSSGVLGNNDSSWPKLSTNGRFVTFRSVASNLVAGDTNGFDDIFIKDTQTGSISVVSANSSGVLGNNPPSPPSLSADGRYVAFSSNATNLVVGDTNGTFDIFIKDTQTGTISLVSRDSTGVQGDSASYVPSLSPDGLSISFTSASSNLVPAKKIQLRVQQIYLKKWRK